METPVSIADFIENPKAYCESHTVQFTHAAFPPAQAGMQVGLAVNHVGWGIEEYTMVPGYFTYFEFVEARQQMLDGTVNFNRIGTGTGHYHTVKPIRTPIDAGIRYLPWKADTVTWMRLDPAATTFFTGPLSGCSIFIGRQGGTYWAFHSNRNNLGAHNPAIKSAMVNAAVAQVPGHAHINLIHRAIYGQEYTHFGFVYGRLRPTGWKFYTVNTAPHATLGGHAVTTQMRLP
jgi:hypothetical protein